MKKIITPKAIKISGYKVKGHGANFVWRKENCKARLFVKFGSDK